jgi:hypothetical protein
MKNQKLFAMILVIGMIALSCEKEGPAGPQGLAGTNGTNGNANVMVYSYGTTIFNSANSYWNTFTPAGLTSANYNSSIFLSYYKNDSYWYTVGGMGPFGMGYQTRQFLSDTPHLNIKLNNYDGTDYSGFDVIWDSVKVYIVPANIFAIAKDQHVNFNDYNSVADYYDKK